MKYFLFTLTLFIFISCGQVSNINFNDSVVNLYDSFTQRNIELEKSVFSDTISVQKRLKTLDNFENFTDSCITVMNEIQPPEDAEKFHESGLEVYKMIRNNYIPILRKMVKEEDINTYNQLVQDYNEIILNIENLENKAIAEQEKYAEKVKMKIQ